MLKTFCFLSGIGRSGSTVLASVLSQNPEIYVTATSLLLDLLWMTKDSWRNKINQSKTHKVEAQLENIYKGVIQGTWAHVDKPLIIDKHRAWPRNSTGIKQMFGIEKPKIICTVRDVASCVASFITLIEKNPGTESAVDQLLKSRGLPLTLENRCDCIWSDFLQNVYESMWIGWNECREHLLVIDYEEITGQTGQTLKRIYDFIDQPYYAGHDLEHIANAAPENDIFWGFDGLHDIRPRMAKVSRPAEEIIGDYAKRFAGMDFWRQNNPPMHLPSAQLIACQPRPTPLQAKASATVPRTSLAFSATLPQFTSLAKPVGLPTGLPTGRSKSLHKAPPPCLTCAAAEFSPDGRQYRCSNAHIDEQLNLGIHGRHREAAELSTRLCNDYPHCHRIAFNQGWHEIARGQLQKGFELLDRGRWENVFGSPPLGSGKPIPRPEVSLSGKTILLHGEGGLGDEIINVRFVQDFAQRDARVVVSCSASLAGVFKRIAGVVGTVPREHAASASHDYWVPAMSAIRITGHELNTLSGKPYLTADPARVGHWRKRIAEEGQLKVGLKWSGNPRFEHQQHRLFPQQLMSALTTLPGARFYGLQKEGGVDLPPGVSDLSPFFTDWEETAAAISNLDLVITSCTSIAHMAAALGKPTWVLVPLLPYYMWATPGNTSAWYDSIRLFRQEIYGDWSAPFAQIEHALADVIQHHQTPREAA